MNLNFRVVIPLIITFYFIYLNPQLLLAQKDKDTLDSLKKTVQNQRTNGQLTKARHTNSQIIEICIASNLKDELADAYLTAGNLCSNQSRFEEAFKFLERASKVSGVIDPVVIKARAFAEYGRNYQNLGFYQYAEESYNDGLIWARQINNANVQKSLERYLHGLRALLYERQGNYSKSLEDLCAGFSLSKRPIIASRIAKHYTVYEWNQDSALFYLEEADRLLQNGMYTTYQESILLRNRGRYLIKIQEYDKALETLEKSIETAKVLGKPLTLLETYELINEAASLSGKVSTQRFALEEIRKLNDSLSLQKRRAVEIPLHRARENYAQQSRRRLFLWTSGALTFLLCGFIVFRRQHKQKETQIQKKLEEYTEREEELENLIDVNHVDLHNKLIDLAHENSPDFLMSFNHLYPKFIEKLKEIDPNVRNSEVSFCAMTFLDLTSKEIAAATFVTTRAVQVRKNRLRKKYQIDSSVDFNQWMQELMLDSPTLSSKFP